MSIFFEMRDKTLPAAIEEVFLRLRLAREALPKELHAVTTIQKWARGFLTRRRIDRLRMRVVCIQKWWRGYLGRQRAQLARELRDRRLREDYFSAMATTIQRHWRGCWSRKYLFDFYARKLYLMRVTQLNAQMRLELLEEGERAAFQQRGLAEGAARSAFNTKIAKLHHLLSTSSQPGIFASPYALAAGNIPMVAGAPVEDHLRTAFAKDPLYKPSSTGSSTRKAAQGGVTSVPARAAPLGPLSHSQGGVPHSPNAATSLPPIKHASRPTQPAASGQPPGQLAEPGVAGGGTRLSSSLQLGSRPRSKGPPYGEVVYMEGLQQVVPRQQTLRQVVPYDTVRKAELLEQKVVKAEMLVRHPLAFLPTGQAPDPLGLSLQSTRNLEPYTDPWDPTVGARHETFTPNQQRVSPTPFTRFNNRQLVFDPSLRPAAEAFPPTTFKPAQAQPHPAGLTSADMRRLAKQPT